MHTGSPKLVQAQTEDSELYKNLLALLSLDKNKLQ